ncbi:MAG: N-acetyltransferase [Novosphingobium sp.]|nr:N-acetyltransferase [Novosphingobium sp.]
MDFTIRPEAPGDEQAIYDLVARAFAPMPFSGGDEQDLVNLLRERGELVLSLVAVDPEGSIVGHIGFSPATIDHAECGWFQMAPVSADTHCQRQGIGSALIGTGIEQLGERGAKGVAVVGDPNYYERFGFAVIPGLSPLSDHDAPYFRAMTLAGDPPSGTLRYASAFG